MCRGLAKLGHTAVVYSRDRSRQIESCPGCVCEVGDVACPFRLRQAMSRHNVDAVVHAAANKHVDVCERSPSTAVASILGGTESVLRRMAESDRPLRGVFVSSDKARHGDQVYGACKRLAERLVSEYAPQIKGKVNSLRLGNLFGSRGSVIPVWRGQIERGEDVQLRVFDGKPPIRIAMLPPEAAAAVLAALFGDATQTGGVLYPEAHQLRVVNIATLAEVMTEGTASKVVRVAAGTWEHRVERLGDGADVEGLQMDHQQTLEFYRRAVEEPSR